MMNYIMNGIQALKESFFPGLLIYIAILALLYLFKKRRSVSWKCIFGSVLRLLRYAAESDGNFYIKLSSGWLIQL